MEGVKIRDFTSFFRSAEEVDPESYNSYNDITGFGVWALSNSLLGLLQRNACDKPSVRNTISPYQDSRFDPRGKIVVEIGAGSGALSIGAAMLGAKKVVCTDLEQNIAYIEANIKDNAMQASVVAKQVLYFIYAHRKHF
jgi:predicted RNA methylase